jgi:chromosome segregation ATPase
MDRLDSENNQLRAKYTADVTTLQGDVQALIQDLEASQAANCSANAAHGQEVSALGAEIYTLQQQLASATSLVTDLRAKYSSDVESLQEQLKSHSAALSQLRNTYTTEVNSLQQQLSTASTTATSLRSTYSAEVKTLRQELDVSAATVQDLRVKYSTDMHSLQSQADSLRTEVTRLEGQRTELEARLASSEANWRWDVEETQKRCDKDILGLLRELSSAREDCISSAATVVDLQKVVDLAFEERRCLAGETDKWKRAHESSEQEVQTLRSSMTTLQEDMDSLRAAVDRESKAAAARVAGLHAELGAALAASRAQDTRCSELQLRNRELCVQLMEVQEQVTQERLRASELEVREWVTGVCVCERAQLAFGAFLGEC